MKERPILFSRSMVRAILEGRKSQTRRIVKPQYSAPRVPPRHMEPWLIDGEQQYNDGDGLPMWAGFHPDYPGEAKWFTCPYGGPGWRLWVRETWMAEHFPSAPGEVYYHYRADDTAAARGWTAARMWKPSIHMPRVASRLLLEVTDMHIQRVQDISEADAQHEGWDWSNIDVYQTYDPVQMDSARQWFKGLWNSINGPRGYGWEQNPWVWCVTFKRVQP
jgi:hypothetical protein